nr:LuxR C-terminal-related transcriptional regulator [Bradyrhizobium uaiense]
MSPREKQLLRRFARGKSDKTTAHEIGGTEQVAAQRAMLLKKLQICSQEHLVSVASQFTAWRSSH